jgi:hypothetical protein
MVPPEGAGVVEADPEGAPVAADTDPVAVGVLGPAVTVVVLAQAAAEMATPTIAHASAAPRR